MPIVVAVQRTRARLSLAEVARADDLGARRDRVVARARRREARARVALALAIGRAVAGYRLAERELEELEADLSVVRTRLRHAGYLR